jgi:CO/xanthine dehydrogenase Mo-binding subunit
VKSCGLTECLEKVAEKIKWREKRANPKSNRGLGIACGVHFTGIRLPTMPDTDFAEAKIMINDDGSVNLTTSCVDIGQGSTTVLTQIAAEVLGIEIEKFNTHFGDTETCPVEWGTRASRVTAIGGMAVKRVAEKARELILRIASEKFDMANLEDLNITHLEDLDIRNSKVFIKSNPDKSITVAEVARYNRFRENGGAIMATDHWDAPSHGNISATFSFGAKAIEMEVDPGTGRTKVIQVVAANDLGRAINPLGACGQIEGGVYMGLGMAYSEEIILNNKGAMENNNFLDYRVLTVLDMPPVTPILVESNDPVGAFGAKGVGEMALIGTAEAFISALHEAAGVWIRKLPATPEKVLMAMKKKMVGEWNSR